MSFGTIRISKEDALFSRLVRLRDRQCVRCKKRGEEDKDGNPIAGLQCSHFIGRGHYNTRFDPDNGDALCTGCHSYWETHKGTKYREWKIKQLGEERFHALELRGREIIKFGKFERFKKKRELMAMLKEMES